MNAPSSSDPANPSAPPAAGGEGASAPAGAPGAGAAAAPGLPPPSGVEARAVRPFGLWLVAGFASLVAVVAMVVAWQSQQRLQTVEQEVVRRQQDLQTLAAETSALARRAEDSAREAAAKSALLEARVAEVAVQRTQLEDLIQSLSRSRDENLLVDIEAALRVAQQQSALTGSAEPLVATLRQADERLARYNQPRLEGVRRAIARDIERVRAVGVADVASLVLRLDEVVRLVDELPLLAAVEQRAGQGRRPAAPPAGPAGATRPAAAGSSPAAGPASAAAGSPWWESFRQGSQGWVEQLWGEVRSLVRITRVDQPEAMLLAPEQAFYLRENLKLRLLNARLALLSRQFDTARVDLQGAQAAIERYFDPASRRTTTALEAIRQVATQSRQVTLPRPDDTLAALATAAAGR